MGITNNTTDGEFPSMRASADAIDKASVWFSLITGIPGNIFIFLTIGSFPTSVATFHFQLLALMDIIALCLQVSIRVVDWYSLSIINSNYAPIYFKIYFNVAYFMSIYANWVLVYIAVERLIALRYPSQVAIYLTVPRAKVNAVLTALLMASFCAIVNVKMKYFGIAWLVVCTTFYTAFPGFIVFIIIWLLLGTMEKRRRDKKALKKEREKHHHHHHHQKNHKDGYKTPVSGITPTGTGSYIPIGGHIPSSAHTPTMTKSVSGLSKHSTCGAPIKHDDHIPGTTTSASRHTLSLSFTGNQLKSLTNTPEHEHESLEVQTRKAKDKKELEGCYTSMMLALCVTFVLLTIPYTIIEYIYVTAEREITDVFDEKQAKMYLLIVLALALMLIEHSCNFYIFFLCSWKFRQQFIRLITRKKTLPPLTDHPKESDQVKSFV